MAATNTSDGLHLFFDAFRSADKSKENDQEILDTLMEVVKLAVKPDRTREEDDKYDILRTKLDQYVPKATPPPADFEFNIPERSLDNWLNYLQSHHGIYPIKDCHFREYCGSLYANTNEDSWEVAVEEAGFFASDEAVNTRENLIGLARQAQQHFDNTPIGDRQGNRPVIPDPLTDDEIKAIATTAERNARRINRNAERHDKVWILLKKQSPNNSKEEDMLLRYTDDKRQKPDWNAVVQNLKDYGESQGYAARHYKQALDRWVSFFLPTIQTITEKMNPLSIARLLIAMHKPKSLFDILQKNLTELVRLPHEDLECKIALLKSIATSMYAEYPESERIANVDRILLNGILQFTSGPTQRNAKLAIEFERRKGNIVKYEPVLQGAIASERIYGPPDKPLPYNTPVTTLDLFNASVVLPGTQKFTPVDEVDSLQLYNLSLSSDSKKDKKTTKKKNDKPNPRKWNQDDIKKGVNCSADYDPKREFRCLKCLTEQDHHEFYCKKYFRRGKYVCINCREGFHYAEECKEDSYHSSRDKKYDRSDRKDRHRSRQYDRYRKQSDESDYSTDDRYYRKSDRKSRHRDRYSDSDHSVDSRYEKKFSDRKRDYSMHRSRDDSRSRRQGTSRDRHSVFSRNHDSSDESRERQLSRDRKSRNNGQSKDHKSGRVDSYHFTYH